MIKTSEGIVFSSEWDEFAQKTYESNFGESPFGDITKSETKNFIPKNYELFYVLDFLVQPFSYAGLKQGFDETRGTLFFDILEILKNTTPKMFY
jgi:DNA (cytosine-5)-methyltransferase 1